MPLLPILTRRQWATVTVIAFSEFATAVCISIQAPFYPAEAERKGATPSQYGFVFGCYQLVIFLLSPIIGKYLRVLIPNYMLISGLFLTGSCSILFGVLDRMNTVGTFIGFSFAVRIFEALGTASFLTSAFAIIAEAFPNSVATTFATLETSFGIGLITGPAVGGLLFELGGYGLPFFVVGALLIAATFLSWVLLPTSIEPLINEGNGGLLKILRIPSVLLASFSVFTASFAIGFLDATLEPHLRQFHLTPAVLGLVFIIEGFSCATTGPIWGRLCDRLIAPKTAIFIGSILVSCGILIGPVPFLPLDTPLQLVIVGLILVGIGLEALLVAGFSEAFQAARSRGFPDNLSTYGVISGLWGSSFALGAFAGPSLAGIFMDHFGFRKSTYLVLITSCLSGLFAIPFLFMKVGQTLSNELLVVPHTKINNYSTLNDEDDEVEQPIRI